MFSQLQWEVSDNLRIILSVNLLKISTYFFKRNSDEQRQSSTPYSQLCQGKNSIILLKLKDNFLLSSYKRLPDGCCEIEL